MAKDILDSDNPEMDEVFWADTIVDTPTFSEEKCPRINGPISRREILLSKTIGMPYPTYITSGISDHNHDEYRNEIRRPRDGEWDIVDKYKDTLEDRAASIRTKCLAEEARVSAKDIAEADREQALTTTEVGGFKGFMKKLLDKFKGKGEK